MDEPTAALGVKESRRVLELILDVKKRGLPIVLISHNMPHVFEVADRIHIHRLGRRLVRHRSEGIYDVRRGRLHDRRQAAAGSGDGCLNLRRACDKYRGRDGYNRLKKSVRDGPYAGRRID